MYVRKYLGTGPDIANIMSEGGTRVCTRGFNTGKMHHADVGGWAENLTI